MLVRVLNFLIGALLGAGGAYLAWNERNDASSVFPPGPEGEPWLFILGLAAAITGVVCLFAAVIPRPKRAARVAAAAAERKAKLGAAENYYGDPARAAAAERSSADRASADRDWRSGDLPPPPKPVPVPPPTPAEPLLKPVSPPAAAAPPPPAATAPAPPPAPEPSVPATARPVAVKPVATSAPPAGQVVTPFPSTATLAPIPHPADHPPAQAPAIQIAAPAPAAHAPSPAAAAATDFSPIRDALAAGKLDEADKLLSAQRDTAQGEVLAELTGLAGDHAAAAGRQSNAKWLWRLALKRFGECNAMNSPAARAVAERLRLADN